MGTECAQTYATLLLGFLKEDLYDIIEETFDGKFRCFETMWCRLDNCFKIMKTNLQDLNKLNIILNPLFPCIKFTIAYKNENLKFCLCK